MGNNTASCIVIGSYFGIGAYDNYKRYNYIQKYVMKTIIEN